MIQFNLLPDVKIEYLKTKRLKRLIFLGSLLVISVCGVVLLVLFSIVLFGQPRTLTNLDKSIKSTISKIKETEGIDKVLTIQNQLTAIDGLHVEKPRVEKLFIYLTQITPQNISIESFDIDITGSTMDVKGQANSVVEMNKYVDTLKFTTINYGKKDESPTETRAFSQVVLNSYSINEDGTGFSLSFKYDSAIFKSENTTISLVVPKITSTRSDTERPVDLFKKNVTPTGEEEIE